jgi:DNA-binding transcriptional regulator PaaX
MQSVQPKVKGSARQQRLATRLEAALVELLEDKKNIRAIEINSHLDDLTGVDWHPRLIQAGIRRLQVTGFLVGEGDGRNRSYRLAS